MLRLDLTDFFPSITQIRIYRFFYDLGYTKQIARLLSGLCTLDGSLPQGAPTSPMLSNLILKEFDEQIFEYCKNQSIFYTRYADDMTFSCNNDINDMRNLIKYVRNSLARYGLKINHKKTSYAGPGARKYVNGIVVNKKLNILRSERKELRQLMYYIRKYGINGHIRECNISTPNYIDHIMGRLNFAYFVTKEIKYKNDLNYLKEVKKITV